MSGGEKILKFDLLSKFCLAVLTVPHSTAEVERIFSVLGGFLFLGNIKTKNRNRLG